jgi:hypothetical protein
MPIVSTGRNKAAAGRSIRGNAEAGRDGIFNTIGQFGGFVAPYIIGITNENSGSYASGMMIIAAGLGIERRETTSQRSLQNRSGMLSENRIV